MRSGLLGRKLGHSYSPQIHALMGSYSYDLFEKEPEDVADFVRNAVLISTTLFSLARLFYCHSGA